MTTDPSFNILQLLEKGIDIGANQTESIMRLRNGEGVPYIIIGKDQRVQSLKEYLLPDKAFARQYDEVESFVEAVNYYKDARTRAYCCQEKGAFRVVIDEHEPDLVDPTVQRRRQLLDLQLTMTPEAKAWLNGAGKQMLQLDFALFLEDNGWVVTRPSAAEFAEVAITLQAKKDVKFRSGLRLDNGDHKLLFEEDTRTAAGVKGTLEVPNDFAITLAIYHGGPQVTIEGKLRYRLQEGAVAFSWKFPRAETVLREYVTAIRQSIADQTGLFVASVMPNFFSE